jgi:ATP-grasp domain
MLCWPGDVVRERVEMPLSADTALGRLDPLHARTDRIDDTRNLVRATGHQLDGSLVQAMAPEGEELIAGAVGDPAFGPLVTIGAGGTTPSSYPVIAGEHRAALVDARARLAPPPPPHHYGALDA